MYSICTYIKIWNIYGIRKKQIKTERSTGLILRMLLVFLKMSGLWIISEQIAEGEQRFVTVGMDFLGRILVVVYTYRENDIRVISARSATKGERKIYEQRKI